MADFKVQRSNLSDQVIEQIQSYIAAKGLQPGDPLPPEVELADIFGVSRTVIRESLSSLNATGVIETQSGRRPLVSGLSSAPLISFFNNATRLDNKAVREFIEVRKAMMLYMIEQATARASEQDIEELQNLCKRVQTARQAGASKQAEHDEADRLFYQKLNAICHNSVLIYMISTLRDALNEKVSSASEGIAPQLKDAVRKGMGHCRLVDAIATKDPLIARELVSQHFASLLSDAEQPW